MSGGVNDVKQQCRRTDNDTLLTQLDRDEILKNLCESYFFPLGTFPYLYQEDDTRPWKREPWISSPTENDKLLTGQRHSYFALPVKRAVWIAQGKVKQAVHYD